MPPLARSTIRSISTRLLQHPHTKVHSKITLTTSTTFPGRHYSTSQSTQDSCACSDPPAIPSTHPIDTTSPLRNTAPTYHTHLLLHTGQKDWSSKIDFESWPYGDLVTALRSSLKSVPERKVLVGLSSFSPPPAPSVQWTESPGAETAESTQVSATLLPSHEVLFASLKNQDSITEFAAKLASAAVSPRIREVRGRSVTILLCSHGNRDVRCGVLGPWLRERICGILQGDDELKGRVEVGESSGSKIPVRVGLVSHIGGHKWAGNVIFYSNYGDGDDGRRRARGIWYGRVNESNVESVLKKTVLGFLNEAGEEEMIIGELCRGTIY